MLRHFLDSSMPKKTRSSVIFVDSSTGTGISQLVERPTELQGAILTRVRVPD